jgi:glycosyltransferase involved in cell wall biosynthesis
MKVIFPFSYYYPEQCAGIFVVDDVMHRLADEGDESKLYVPTPTRNVRQDVEWKRHELLCAGKIKIHRFRMYQEGKNPILRALRYVFCEVVYLHHLLWDDYDVAFIDSTPPIQGLKLPIVRLLRKKPVVYNVQDLFPDTLSGTGLAKKGGILWKMGSWVARVTYNSSDKLIAISEDIKRTLIEEKGVSEEKIEVVYNWVNQNVVVPVAKEDNPLFEEFNISRDKFYVVYAGNIGNAQNIDVIVDSAKEMVEDKDVNFLIFGTGGLKEQFVEKVKNYGIDNVRFFPLQPMEGVSQVYSLGDVCVVSCKPGLGGAAMPSKMLSIMSAGRAVIASFDEGELTYILKNYNCGMYAPAGNVQAFVQMVRTMASDRKLCEEMGKNARKLILERFTREYATLRYVDIIRKVTENGENSVLGKRSN